MLGFDIYKKSQKHMEILAEKERISLEEFSRHAVYFGDGPGDMRIAKSSGLYSIGIAQTVSTDALKNAGADLVLIKIGDAMAIDWERINNVRP